MVGCVRYWVLYISVYTNWAYYYYIDNTFFLNLQLRKNRSFVICRDNMDFRDENLTLSWFSKFDDLYWGINIPKSLAIMYILHAQNDSANQVLYDNNANDRFCRTKIMLVLRQTAVNKNLDESQYLKRLSSLT